ncbi:methylated-DNA--protein-cysteine methyltransferase-like [Bicyclus anynana]|uniref:Methylated-DNA--protein-cysteine methyltransferase n=1 Tax=Bicyclus anynana TaxID=110368 RepID=A0A6J1P6P1_BICAN|nr:methylated-DNA--protein-cysteine methyltransferase-like [Bicyclus anynana]
MNLSDIIKRHSRKSGKLVYVYKFNSPIGSLIACADQEYIHLVCFEDSKNCEKMLKAIADKLNCEYVEETNKILEVLEYEIQQYFDGKLKKFNVPMKTFGTELQKEVWEKLIEIPYGTTQTYGTLAKEMGRSASHSRAVGAACGANAHIILIPCHRLVAAGSGGGFSCGVDRKEWLINHEKKISSKQE